MDAPREPLHREFYDQPTEQVARALIGCLVVHDDAGTPRIGRIVETEAYLGVEDRACHSHRGRTPRTEVMFGPPGRAYVYFIYGMHHCLNAVTRPEGSAEAVLIRAIEPVSGCLSHGSGPGLVCKALGIDKRHNGLDLTQGVLTILPGDRPAAGLARGPRVGVDYAGHWARRHLRFYEKDNPHVSRAGRSARARPALGRRGAHMV